MRLFAVALTGFPRLRGNFPSTLFVNSTDDPQSVRAAPMIVRPMRAAAQKWDTKCSGTGDPERASRWRQSADKRSLKLRAGLCSRTAGNEFVLPACQPGFHELDSNGLVLGQRSRNFHSVEIYAVFEGLRPNARSNHAGQEERIAAHELNEGSRRFGEVMEIQIRPVSPDEFSQAAGLLSVGGH